MRKKSMISLEKTNGHIINIMDNQEMIKMKIRVLAGLLTVIMTTVMFPGNMMGKAEAVVTLKDPDIVADASVYEGQKVTYDCIWFGSYPQTEIVDKASRCGTYDKPWAQTSDCEKNSSLYTSLKNAGGWDKNGDMVLDGIRYRRIKSSDATKTSSSEYYYEWGSSDIYHYFRYEPIKWRVLDVISNSQVLLLADKGLDDRKYNSTNIGVTWKTSTIRSWLNGYGPSANTCGTDYTGSNFINLAFGAEERSTISPADLDNQTTGDYSESRGGENTTDKVFLLSAYDIYSSAAASSYGFYKTASENDQVARITKATTYAKAMGAWTYTQTEYFGNCYWWLRSPGSTNDTAAYVSGQGNVGYDSSVMHYNKAVRPALFINPSSSDLCTYAGTVCSDGTIKEKGYEEAVAKMRTEPADSTPAAKSSQTITASGKTIAINSKPVSLGAKTSGNGKLTYSSSAPSVASVSSAGKITPKKYGTATITIKAAETSTCKAASKKIKVTVVPKKMKISGVSSPSRKTLVVKWKKDKAATKYELQLCLKKDFKKKKSKKYGKKVSTQKIKNLKSKTWYVRIRALKKVGGKTYYGVWSRVKSVKVR